MIGKTDIFPINAGETGDLTLTGSLLVNNMTLEVRLCQKQSQNILSLI